MAHATRTEDGNATNSQECADEKRGMSSQHTHTFTHPASALCPRNHPTNPHANYLKKSVRDESGSWPRWRSMGHALLWSDWLPFLFAPHARFAVLLWLMNGYTSAICSARLQGLATCVLRCSQNAGGGPSSDFGGRPCNFDATVAVAKQVWMRYRKASARSWLKRLAQDARTPEFRPRRTHRTTMAPEQNMQIPFCPHTHTRTHRRTSTHD